MSVIFSSNITLNTKPGDVANRPRILLDNVFQQGVVTASSEVSANNGWFENAVDGLTFDWWEWSALPATLEVELPAARPVDMCAIALHTGLTFVYQYWDGSAWVDLHDPVTTTATAVYAVIFDEATSTKFRISITAAPIESILGVVILGKSLQLPKTFYGGHAPIVLNRTTQIVRNKTEAGFDAGVYSLRTGAATSVEINNIKPGWIRDNLEALNKDLEIKPFIFAWRPDTHPNDVAYCWLNSPITANNSGPKDYMSLRFDVQAFVGGLINIRRTYFDLIMSRSPYAYWRLGESSGVDMLDSSGNDLHGIYENSPTLGTEGLLINDPNKAVAFSGTQFAGGQSLGGMQLPVSIEMLVKVNTAQNRNPLIMTHDSTTRDVGIRVFVGALGEILVYLYANNFKILDIFKSFTFAGVGFTPGARRLLQVVVVDTTEVFIYVDGVRVDPTSPPSGSATGVSFNTSSGTSLRIAYMSANNSLLSGYFSGVIDEVSIYSNRALTQEDANLSLLRANGL